MWESSVNMPDVSASKAGLSLLLRLPGSSLLRKVPGSSILFKYENLLLRTLLRWTQVGRSSGASCACRARPPPSPGASLAELQSAITKLEKMTRGISTDHDGMPADKSSEATRVTLTKLRLQRLRQRLEAECQHRRKCEMMLRSLESRELELEQEVAQLSLQLRELEMEKQHERVAVADRLKWWEKLQNDVHLLRQTIEHTRQKRREAEANYNELQRQQHLQPSEAGLDDADSSSDLLFKRRPSPPK